MSSSDEFKRIIRKYNGKSRPLGDVLPDLKPQQKEFKLQRQIIEKHGQYFPHVLITAFPGRPSGANDEERARDGKFKQLMGVRAGVSDLLLWWKDEIRDDGRLIWKGCVPASIELKVKTDTRTSQNKWLSAFDGLEGHTGIVRSWEQYYHLLCSWGIKPTHPCTIFSEPDYRTESQKYIDSFEMFVP